MSTNDRARLRPRAYDQARAELEQLLLSHRADAPHDDGADVEAWARREWRERRIRHLQELLLTASVGEPPPDDGVAEAGMVVTVRLDDAADTETFLLAESHVVPTSAEIDVYSLASPIGRALVGAREGDTRSCLLPDGQTMSITLVAATPYGLG